MKLIAFLLLAIAAIFASADFNADAVQCLALRPKYHQAINKFCKRDIVVPSGYAQRGTKVGGKAVIVTGDCELLFSTLDRTAGPRC